MRQHRTDPLSKAQLRALVDATRGEAFAARDRAILGLLWASGLRVAELVALDVGDVNLAAGLVRVIGKGNKPGVVPVAPAAIAWLRTSIGLRQRGPLFVSADHQRISARLVRRLIDKYAAKAGITGPVSPHTLRHSAASQLLAGGMYLYQVQAFLRHVHADTTLRYLHPAGSQPPLAAAYTRCHPLARPQARDGWRARKTAALKRLKPF